MELDIYDLNCDQLQAYIKIMHEDLRHIVSMHKANCRLSDRDIDDIECTLLDLQKPVSYKNLV
jgi:hypothetical protein